jgi:cyclic pyranopterin monophosphate synthase
MERQAESFWLWMPVSKPLSLPQKTFCQLQRNPLQKGMKKLTHIDARGEASMVDVSAKPVLLREAVAQGEIRLQKATLTLIQSQTIAKGNVLASARLAGILAAKKTGDLIPLCHPLPLTHCEVNFNIPRTLDRITISASARIAAQTGVEMEALTAVAVAALTIYDMCKAVDKTMKISNITLLSKTKGKPHQS